MMSRRVRLEWAKLTWDMGPLPFETKRHWLRVIWGDLWKSIKGI